jgi:hypothetical protein
VTLLRVFALLLSAVFWSFVLAVALFTLIQSLG